MFHEADKNKDGKISLTEWNEWHTLQQRRPADRKKIQISLPLPNVYADDLVRKGGLQIAINGVHYDVQLSPVATAEELLLQKQTELAYLHDKLRPLLQQKFELDARAHRSARRTLWAGTGWLLVQAGIVFKLTFYSRFGWDVMEPICYFLTFGVGVGGLTFFQLTNVDFTYPSLLEALSNRRKRKLYAAHDFPLDKFDKLNRAVRKKELEVTSITAPGPIRQVALGLQGPIHSAQEMRERVGTVRRAAAASSQQQQQQQQQQQRMQSEVAEQQEAEGAPVPPPPPAGTVIGGESQHTPNSTTPPAPQQQPQPQSQPPQPPQPSQQQQLQSQSQSQPQSQSQSRRRMARPSDDAEERRMTQSFAECGAEGYDIGPDGGGSLPEGWREVSNNLEVYYFNERTGRTTWDRPL